MTVVRRSVHDREIVLIALPALGALAAEPLYLLADTAIVGHLGTTELAALALAATVLTLARRALQLPRLRHDRAGRAAARRRPGDGGGRPRRRRRCGSRCVVGVALTALTVALAAPIVHLLGGDGAVADAAARYLRIAAIGLPCAMLALAGQGWLRGVGDLRSPLVIVVVASVVNVVLELVLVYGLDLGLDGSAWGTVVAQLGMGAAFAWLLLRAPAATRRPVWALIRPMTRMGAQIVVRTGVAAARVRRRERRARPHERRGARRQPGRLPALRVPRARARRARDRRAGPRRPRARRGATRRRRASWAAGCASCRSPPAS